MAGMYSCTTHWLSVKLKLARLDNWLGFLLEKRTCHCNSVAINVGLR